MSRVNRKLLPLKLLLFFLYAAFGCLMPFLTIHMYHIGLSHEEVTWINAVLPLTALIGPTLGGYLADKSGNYRLIIVCSMVLAAIFHTALLFVPETSPTFKPILQMVCDNDGSAFVLQSCSGYCPDVKLQIDSRFTISNCREVCDLPGKNCRSFSLPRLDKSQTIVAGSEVSSDLYGGSTKVCFHGNSSEITSCDEFSFETSVKIYPKLGSHSSIELSTNHFEAYKDCCEYRLSEFSTESDRKFNNITCRPTSPECHVLCEVDETSKSYLLQSQKCFIEGDRPKLTFWLYFVLRSFADMFPAVLISLCDAVVLTMVSKHGGDYGRQKMFGLFAIGLSAPLVGYLVDQQIGVYGKYVYSPVFYVFDALLILTAIITLTLPIKVEVHKSSMMNNLSQLIRTYELNILFVIVTLLGLLYGYLETFLYIHLSENLNASKLLLGLTITVGILPSVPFLYKSDLVVNYCGHHYLLILAFVGYCVRFASLSCMTNPHWVIPIEVLELFTLNLMQVSAATLAYKLAPKTLVATAQSLVWLAHFDIGRALGTVIGGYLIKLYGMIVVFEAASVFSAVCAIIYLASYQLFKHVKARRAQAPLAEQPKENGTLSNGSYLPLPVTDQKS